MTDSVFLTKLCVALFVTTSLLHAGLALTVAQVRAPLRSRWLLVGALIGNFVLVPAAALIIARLFRLSDGLSLGLLLVGMSAGAPFLPRLAPLAAGMAIRAWNPSFAGRLGPPLKGISRVAMLVLLVAVNFERVRSVGGSGALAAAGLLILVALGIGFVTGGTSPERRRVLALGTGQRGISAALLIATHVAQDPDAAVMVVVVILVGELILFSSAASVGRWAKKTARPLSP